MIGGGTSFVPKTAASSKACNGHPAAALNRPCHMQQPSACTACTAAYFMHLKTVHWIDHSSSTKALLASS